MSLFNDISTCNLFKDWRTGVPSGTLTLTPHNLKYFKCWLVSTYSGSWNTPLSLSGLTDTSNSTTRRFLVAARSICSIGRRSLYKLHCKTNLSRGGAPVISNSSLIKLYRVSLSSCVELNSSLTSPRGVYRSFHLCDRIAVPTASLPGSKERICKRISSGFWRSGHQEDKVLRSKKSNPKVLQWEQEQDYEFRRTLPMYMFWFSQTIKSNIKKHIFLL